MVGTRTRAHLSFPLSKGSTALPSHAYADNGLPTLVLNMKMSEWKGYECMDEDATASAAVMQFGWVPVRGSCGTQNGG